MRPWIDTHLHLLYPQRLDYDWTKSLPVLDRAHVLEEYAGLAQPSGIRLALHMEADVRAQQMEAETDLIGQLARQPDSLIAGAISSCRPEHDEIGGFLERALSNPLIHGFRRVLHVVPDELSTSATFRRNVRALTGQGHPFDLCVLPGQFHLADALAKACPESQGERALNFFVDLYKSGAVPKGVPNYIWDDLGQGFASGNIALNLDWGGWAGFFNDPKNSRIAGNVGIARAPRGSSGKRTGWAGSHGFSITKACDNPKAAASLVMTLTSLDAQMIEARNGMMPTRMDAQKQAAGEFTKKGDKYMLEVFQTFAKGMAEDAFTPPLIPEWIEASNAIWPELQKALIGEKTGKQALDDAANKVLAIMQDAGRVR